MATDTYDALAKAVKAAGFFTNGFMNHGNWDRTIVCSKRVNGRLTGNSFWVTRLASGWFLGTWGVFIYRLPDESRIAELCISWLSRAPDGVRYDLDDPLRTEFDLVPVSEAEFDSAIVANGGVKGIEGGDKIGP